MLGTRQTDTHLLKAAEDEPIFVLKASDKLAPVAIKQYALLLERNPEVPENKKKEVWAAAFQMEQWQKERPHRVKLPD